MRLIEEQRVLQILRDLLEAPTVAASDDDYDRFVSVVESYLKPLQGQIMRVYSNGKPNLLATFTGNAPGRTLVWNGHFDTVPVQEKDWTYPPFRLTPADGKVFGRGTADMKGGIASMVAAIEALIADGFPGRIVFCVSADEEIGGADGMEHLVSQGLIKGDLCVVGEPTALNIGYCEKGFYWFRLRVRGRAAHGSTPHLGSNAIEMMADVMAALAASVPQVLHPVLGKATLNIGRIRGGQKVNVVPDECEIEVDRRLLPGERVQGVKQQLEDTLRGLGASVPNLRYELEEITSGEPFETALDQPVIELARQACQRVLGHVPGMMGFTAFTDGRFTALNAGIPTVLLGPGSIAQAHTADEFVSIQELVAAAQIYYELVKSL